MDDVKTVIFEKRNMLLVRVVFIRTLNQRDSQFAQYACWAARLSSIV